MHKKIFKSLKKSWFKENRKRVEKFFSQKESKAKSYINDPKKLQNLGRKVTSIAKDSLFSDLYEDIKALIRLTKAFAKGEYREIAPEKVVLAILGLIYLVSPVDLIPDPIIAIGLIDDISVLGFVISSLKGEIERFRDWEEKREP